MSTMPKVNSGSVSQNGESSSTLASEANPIAQGMSSVARVFHNFTSMAESFSNAVFGDSNAPAAPAQVTDVQSEPNDIVSIIRNFCAEKGVTTTGQLNQKDKGTLQVLELFHMAKEHGFNRDMVMMHHRSVVQLLGPVQTNELLNRVGF